MFIMSLWLCTQSNSSARELQKGDKSYIFGLKILLKSSDADENTMLQWDEKTSLLSIILLFSVTVLHPLICFLHSKPQLGLVISTWCLILKNGFSKIKSLYIYEENAHPARLRSLQSADKRRGITITMQTRPLFSADQIAIWAKNLLLGGRLHLSFNSCCYYLEWLM